MYDTTTSGFRIMRILPGLITIFLLLTPLWATLTGYPEIILYLVAFLSVYWFYKTILTTIGNLVGYRRYKRSLTLPWNKMIKRLDWKALPDQDQLPDSCEAVNVVLLIPFYKEPYSMHRDVIEEVRKSTYDLSKVTIVYCVEERAGDIGLENAKKLLKNYKKYFKDMKYYIHPAGVPGEAIGIAGANLNYGSREYVEELLEKGENLKNYLVMKFDSDVKIHRHFISGFVHTYLKTEDRYHSFFSPAVIKYANNYWDVPVLVRVFSGVLTLALMSEWVTQKRTKQSFSAFGFSLQLLHDIGYFDPKIGVDDTGFYWRAYLANEGRFKGEEFYLPVNMDAVEAESYWKTHVIAYKQLRRWGWGVIVYPMALQAFSKSKKFSFFKKFFSIIELFRVYNLYSTIAFLLTFSIPLFSLLNPDFGLSSSAHILPKIISVILTSTMLGLLPSRWVLEGLYGSPPKEKGIVFFIWHYFEQVMLMVFSLTLGFFPYLQAQIEMMLGKSLDFIVTPKMDKDLQSKNTAKK